jgi:DNA-binding transcriptional LysR family regulator
MEMRQVRYFLSACETLNFSRAAEQCKVSTASLSRAIRDLEDELGGPLFRRERHLTPPTDLGRLMQRHLAAMQAAADAARRSAEDYARLAGSRLKLGVFASIGAGVLTGYLAALRSAAPELELQIWEASGEQLEAALLGAAIDIALSNADEFDARIRPLPLFREAYHVAFARGHRFETMAAVPLRELEGEACVKRLNCEFPPDFARLGIAKPEVVVRYIGKREDWVQAMVRAGLGTTLMPQHLLVLGGIETRPLVEPEISRQISLVTVVGRPHSPPVVAAIETAQRHQWPNGTPATHAGIDA